MEKRYPRPYRNFFLREAETARRQLRAELFCDRNIYLKADTETELHQQIDQYWQQNGEMKLELRLLSRPHIFSQERNKWKQEGKFTDFWTMVDQIESCHTNMQGFDRWKEGTPKLYNGKWWIFWNDANKRYTPRKNKLRPYKPMVKMDGERG
ncbi:hypothetical protein V6R21_20045 [Limibacter armeniacum]|uniref:hypothetical protein n=1 Tax=Limibacter armeniacum TaxID=466084 RepID=UPI002FE5781E